MNCISGRLLTMGIRTFFKRLRRAQGGNAAMLVGLGLPVLVGGTGYAVDTAQWYLWKRELQYAVDQAAIAGAWAKAADESGTGTGYVDRAQREYDANISLVEDFDTGAAVSLEDYDGATNNSVRVTASATGSLPFASYILGTSTTVTATALAIHEPAVEWRPCLLALDENDAKAVEFYGGPTVNAQCGVGSLSDADDAIAITGNAGTFSLGFIISAGGFSDPHDLTGSTPSAVNVGELADPHEGLTAPSNDTPQELTCPAEGVWTADKSTQISLEYSYWTKSGNTYNSTTYASPKSPVTNPATYEYDLEFTSEPFNPTPTVGDTYTEVSGRGNDRIYERERKTTTITYSDKVAPTTTDSEAQPGTYEDFTLACDITLAGGIYVIDGGNLRINAQYSLTGTGVMFVLLNGAGLEINGGAQINLSAMQTVEELVAAGVDAEQAERMKGMLIFEDPEGEGNDGHSINGNSGVIMNGIVYLPNSELAISGSMRGSSTCLELAAATLDVGGDANLTTLCPVNVTPTTNISTRSAQVRLVG
jgi:Flp pilus assembly protein TadG